MGKKIQPKRKPSGDAGLMRFLKDDAVVSGVQKPSGIIKKRTPVPQGGQARGVDGDKPAQGASPQATQPENRKDIELKKGKAAKKMARQKFTVNGEGTGKRDSLRNVTTSGGLFNESAMLRLRDKPKTEPMDEWKGFALKPEERSMSFDHELRFSETWNWARNAWKQISFGFDKFSKSSIFQYWIGELLARLGHQIAATRASDEKQYRELGSLKIDYRQHDYSIPLVHVIQSSGSRPFDEVDPADPEQMTYHDRCQLYVNTFQECPWMILTNGRMIRLITRYSHVYNKSFLQFDLQNIIEGEDQKEFELLYRFLHKSRFIILRDFSIGQEIVGIRKSIERVLVSIPAKLKQKLLERVLEAIEEAIASQDKKGKEIQQLEKGISKVLAQDGITLTKNNEAQIKAVFKDVVDALKDLFPLKAEDKAAYRDVVKEVIEAQIYELSFEKIDSFLNALKDYLIDVHERINKGLIKEYDEADMQAMLFQWNKAYSIQKDIQDVVSKEVKKVFGDELGKIPLIDTFLETCKQQGQQIGKILSKNVTTALEILGTELIHSNPEFREDVIEGKIDIVDFYAEILRVVYRIIFILYAEKRQMFPGEGSLFHTYYSFSRYYQRLEKPILEDPDFDNWENFVTIINLLETGNSFFKVNGFGDFFSISDNLPLIKQYNLKVNNSAFLEVLKKMTTFRNEGIYQPVDYVNLAEEEIGGIYEILLENKPFIEKEYFQFDHDILDRKSSGSYYTAKALIEIMIEQALKPVLKHKLDGVKDKDDKIFKLLSLSVLDPSCGGGSILLAATDYLGKELAKIESESENPSDAQLREARREVVQHCIYGVDINPLAVELCKMSLWLRVAIKNRPLSILDNHIKCGNSLIGLDHNRINKDNSFSSRDIDVLVQPDWVEAVRGNEETGIADEDREVASKVKKNLTKEITNKQFGDVVNWITESTNLSKCYNTITEILKGDEESFVSYVSKKKALEKFQHNSLIKKFTNLADSIISAFFWPFTNNSPQFPTNLFIRNEIVKNDDTTDKFKNSFQTIRKLKKDYGFFHWFLEFPQIFGREQPGFDAVLGNPPWENIQLNEREYFAVKDSRVIEAKKQSERRKIIKVIKIEKPKLFAEYENTWIGIKKQLNYFKKSGWFLRSSYGELTTYALFVERFSNLISNTGRLSMIAPNSLFSTHSLETLTDHLINSNSLVSFFDFINGDIFPIHPSFRFLVLTLKHPDEQEIPIHAIFHQSSPEHVLNIITRMQQLKIKEEIDTFFEQFNIIEFSKEDFTLFNPNTKTSPTFKDNVTYHILKKIYSMIPILLFTAFNTEINPWNLKMKRMFHLSQDSALFIKNSEIQRHKVERSKSFSPIYYNDENGRILVPLYEGKSIFNYNHRFNSSQEGESFHLKSEKTTIENYQDPNFEIHPSYWIEQRHLESKIKLIEGYAFDWFLVARIVTNNTNIRTFISTIIPKTAIANSLTPIYVKSETKLVCCLLANFNSIIFDFIVRQKLSGMNLNYFVIEQLPVFPPDFYSEDLIRYICERVLKLLYTSRSLENFARDCGCNAEPFSWNETERLKLSSELDALFFHLYQIKQSELEYILESFPIVKRVDIECYGRYRTKDLILKYYQELTDAPILKTSNWLINETLIKKQKEFIRAHSDRSSGRSFEEENEKDDNPEETD